MSNPPLAAGGTRGPPLRARRADARHRSAADPHGWLLAQIGPADAARGSGLLTRATALRADRRRAREAPAGRRTRRRDDGRAVARRPLPRVDRRRRALAPRHRGADDAAVRRAAAAVLGQPLHRLAGQGQRARPGRRVRARRDPAEHRRLVRGAAGRRDAPIRRCCATSTTRSRPDRTRASSPRERGAPRGVGEAPRVTGLNENLAREVLELHTLGAASGARAAAALATRRPTSPRSPRC